MRYGFMVSFGPISVGLHRLTGFLRGPTMPQPQRALPEHILSGMQLVSLLAEMQMS